jgi:hypothetical protein
VAAVALGDSAAFRRRITSDVQLKRALALLDSATTQAQLLALAGESM